MNQAVRVAEGVNGTIVVMGVWCPRCREETQPDESGHCHWCKRHVLIEDVLDVKQLLAQIRDGARPAAPTTTEDDLMSDHTCKLPGCDNPARSSVGRYSYCDEHQGMGGVARNGSSANGGGTVEARIKSLAALARDVDRAKAKAAKLTQDALKAKHDAEEKERQFQRQAREVIGEAA